MQKLSLNGVWDLYYFPQGTRRINNPEELSADLPHIKAQVPGNVELDLSREGILPKDLFMGENIRTLKQFENYEWWYETEFAVPDDVLEEKCALSFGGVDCFAEYWLNGMKIGESDNMFLPVELEITGKLRTTNKLSVRIRSAICEAYQKEFPAYSFINTWDNKNFDSLTVRKAPHCYGWDIMPRAVTSGLWKEVHLLVKSECEIKQLYLFCTEVSERKALLNVGFELECENADNMEVRVKGVCGESVFEGRENIHFKGGKFYIDIEQPKLWWPYGYGDANLYTTTVGFWRDGKELARETLKIGIRSVRLERSDITDGIHGNFEFFINDTPILCKGSNWVPLDVFHSRDKERYSRALALVRDIGCNILRCWGGNVYEDQEFYDFCDENGVMIWQDFSMACHAYPQDEAFLQTVKKEAEMVIKERRNHPSVILWSGDNECDEAIYLNGSDPNNNLLTRQAIPQAVAQNDTLRPYLPSSPYFSEEMVRTRARSMMPEDHLWGPRDYYKSSFYTTSRCHFISETGYHGCPNLSSVQKFIDKDHIWPLYNNPQWNLHSTDMAGRDHRVLLMEKQVRQLFGVMPENIEDFIFASQISQAEAKKFFIENVRLHRETKKGIIWWNLLDGWPQMSDAVVDYYFEKKIAYDYIKRSQQPFALMCGEIENWNISLVASNDTLEAKEGSYLLKRLDSDETVANGTFFVKPNSNAVLCEIPVMYSEKGMFLIEWMLNGKRYINHYLYGMPGFALEDYKAWYEKIK